ncbi:MAG: carboxylating nicotinate-nucleotide diphosphorylase [Clostridia bacterium]|nr:carboxylating nicotinate-nucleotide diphosphorylase [Clostridia bacterium]
MTDLFMIDDIIKSALREDVGTGDITTNSTIPADKKISGKFIAKESGVVCGLPVVKRVFEIVDSEIKLSCNVADGDYVEKGDIIAEVSGPARSILTGERVSLNFLQLMSGISTRTNSCVKQVEGTKAMITDTRKTTPGLRVLEKYAVKAGGGHNHRYNLADGVLLKDNHIAAAGGITAAVAAARGNIPHILKIEVEVENMQMIEEAVACGADIIMLDNMSVEEMKKAVDFIDGRALVEASGNMGDRDLMEVAKTGVDIISIGALTHTIKAMDISLRFKV